MVMEDDQEQRFVCRFCNKKCLSGKSLGGHMRGHLALIAASRKPKSKALCKLGSEGGDEMINNSYVLRDEFLSKKSDQKEGSSEQEKLFKNNDMEVEGGYALREKPKKSWKIYSDMKLVAAGSLGKRKRCKECGKGFPSVRALAGHMRCHPVRKRERLLCGKCDKQFDSDRALFGHMKCHSKKSRLQVDDDNEEHAVSNIAEIATLCPIKRKRSRLRYKINSPNISLSSLNNVSSSSLETEIEEVKYVAMCLMMLSRGVKDWSYFKSSTAFVSKEESAILEAESFDQCTGFALSDDENFFGDDETGKMVALGEKLDSGISSAGNYLSDEVITSPLSGYSSGYASCNEGNSDFEVTLDALFHRDEFKKPRQDNSEIEVNADSAEAELDKDTNSDILESAKKPEYKCKTCGKLFNSHQGLGGHQNKHKGAMWIEDPVEAEETKGVMASLESKKSKEHQCLICFKVFPTGQALGGHKRAHYAFNTNQDLPGISKEFHHLDLAISADGVEKDRVGEKLWWGGSSKEHESLILSTTETDSIC